MNELKISHIPKSKEVYMEEAEEYFSNKYLEENSKYKYEAETFLRCHLDMIVIDGEYYSRGYEDTEGNDKITNKDNVEYNESYVRETLFYVMNTTGDEQRLYYERLLFLESWKWDLFSMKISKYEIRSFHKSKLYRIWKIKKVLE